MNTVSVIIPANNEEAVILRSLAALTTGAAPDELEVIVIANGCTDRTADVARSFGGPVTVIETPVGSKSNALNLGDAVATGFPRFYLDADVTLPLEAVRAVAAVLVRSDALAAAPRPELDHSQSSWCVRAYYAIDRQLPWFREGIGNAGVYALSREGRSRFGSFPNITTDDSFVRLHFKPHERVTVQDAVSVVTAPATLRSLIAIKTRSHFSKWEIQAHCPHLVVNEGQRNAPVLLRLCLRPWNWPALAVYAYVKIAARVRCRLRYRLNRANSWERDDTSRLPSAPSVATAAAAAPEKDTTGVR